MIGKAVGATVASAAGLAAAGYWRHMSPYSQSLGHFPFRSDSGPGNRQPTIALTFDDGPNEPYTSQIAALLEARSITATFFQVGRCVERHPGVSQALATAGHVIGNHSYSHGFANGWSKDDVSREVDLAQDVFAEHLGRTPALYRPPWLIRTGGMFEVLAERALRPVSGEFCHALEPVQPSPDRIARRALAKARDGGILIFHDGYDDVGAPRGNTVAAVEIVVDSLLDRGFEFVTVDQLLGVPAYVAS